MKSKALIFAYLITIVLTSCPGLNTDIHPYAILDSREEILLPGETVDIFIVVKDEISAEDWRKALYFPVTALIYSDENIQCNYSASVKTEEIRRINDNESIYKIPLNISYGVRNNNFHNRFMYNYFTNKKVSYPTLAELSKSEVHIGDEVSVVCTKPFFDISTFSQDKLKRLENINYCPIFVKTYGDIHTRIAIPIKDCTVTDPYHISFKVPNETVSAQVLVLNEGGIQDLLPSNLSNIDELRTKYINFNSTSCEKYAYYASKTELLILDASGDRVD